MMQQDNKYLNTIIHADAITGQRLLPDKSVHCVVTSPPYWGLRNYGSNGIVWAGLGGKVCADGQHRWAEQITRKQRGKIGDNWTVGNGFAGGRLTEAAHGCFCHDCGAWFGELGLEPTPELYAAHLFSITAESYRVLRDDGTMWLNLGDSYFGGKGQSGAASPETALLRNIAGKSINRPHQQSGAGKGKTRPQDNKHRALKNKDLVGIPWRIAFALQGMAVVPMYTLREWSEILDEAIALQDWELVKMVRDQLRHYDLLQGLQKQGWYLRSDIIWHKPNPMPESVIDRCTRAHEYIFLLTKSPKYYFNADAIKTDLKEISMERLGRGLSEDHKNVDGVPGQTPHSMNTPRKNVRFGGTKADGYGSRTYSGDEWQPIAGLTGNGFKGHSGNYDPDGNLIGGGKSNRRDVWTITTKAFKGSHFATFPSEIPRLCIQAGCPPDGVVLDPFCGSGTTLSVAAELGCHFIGIDVVEDNVKMAKERILKRNGLFALDTTLVSY